MKAGWRWFGPGDAISLREIRQAGVTDVVTSLYEQAVGAVWPLRRIRETAKACRDNGMAWTVVESVPVHEDVKKRTTGRAPTCTSSCPTDRRCWDTTRARSARSSCTS